MTAKPPAKPKSGALFFSLIDEIGASERRLDEAAAPLLHKMQETEELAKHAIETRIDRLSATQDYIKRMHGVAEQLAEDDGGNNGPTVGSEGSSGSLSEAEHGAEGAAEKPPEA